VRGLVSRKGALCARMQTRRACVGESGARQLLQVRELGSHARKGPLANRKGTLRAHKCMLTMHVMCAWARQQEGRPARAHANQACMCGRFWGPAAPAGA